MRNNKFITTMILGVTALFLASSYNVHAAETTIYKCTCADGNIMFQDVICPADAKIELIKIEMNQSADIPAGLREHEQNVLAKSHERQMHDQELQNKIVVAHLNNAAAAARAHKTEVHVYPAAHSNHYINNQNQNVLSIKYTKVKKP